MIQALNSDNSDDGRVQDIFQVKKTAEGQTMMLSFRGEQNDEKKFSKNIAAPSP